MIKLSQIFFVMGLILCGCDPGWRYRATPAGKTAENFPFSLQISGHYFGSSEIEVTLKNIKSEKILIRPLFAYANSLSCPRKTHITQKVAVTQQSRTETYFLRLPDSHYVDQSKADFDMRELWGKPGSSLSVSLFAEDKMGSRLNTSDIDRPYTVLPAETIRINHSIPTFNCERGYPNAKHQKFELFLPLLIDSDPLVIIIEQDILPNANGS